MPCSDGIPFAREGNEVAYDAIPLLCELLTNFVLEGDELLPKKYVRWFLRHKEIDLAKARLMRNESEEKEALECIKAAQELLKKPEPDAS